MPKHDDLTYWCGAFGAPQEIDFANETADGSEWVRLCAYGDAVNRDAEGAFVQRFDRAAADRIVAEFNSNWNKLKRVLGVASAELPVFNGHPDHQKKQSDTRPQDFRVYTRISALEARDDGLYGLIRRTPELNALVEKLGPREISPRWDMATANESDAAKRIYRPTFLKSVGLVDKGNWPEKSVINESELNSTGENTMQWTEDQQKRLAEILGADDPAQLADPEVVIAKAAALKTAQTSATEAASANTAEAESEKQKREAAEQALADAEKDKQKAVAANEALAEKLIDFGVADGRIAESDREKWKKHFEKDAANSADIFADLRPGTAVPVKKDSLAKTVANHMEPAIAADHAHEAKVRERANELLRSKPSLGFTEAYNRAAKELVKA